MDDFDTIGYSMAWDLYEAKLIAPCHGQKRDDPQSWTVSFVRRSIFSRPGHCAAYAYIWSAGKLPESVRTRYD